MEKYRLVAPDIADLIPFDVKGHNTVTKIHKRPDLTKEDLKELPFLNGELLIGDTAYFTFGGQVFEFKILLSP